MTRSAAADVRSAVLQFGIDMGPRAKHKRVLTIYHKNVSKENWQREMRVWAAQYPLSEGSTAAAAVVTSEASVSAAAVTVSAGSSPADGVTPAARSGPAPAPDPAGTDQTPAPGPAGATGVPTTAGLPPDDRRQRSAWVESRTLHVLRFFQHRAFCCGIEGPGDYQTAGAQTPPSCICRDDGHEYGQQRRPPCTAGAHMLSNGTVSALWKTGCLMVKGELITYLNCLRDTLLATVVLQAAVTALGLVLGLNMPSSLSDDDSDDEGGDY